MNKEEFLQTLGAALSNAVPQHIIQENIRYYDNYISSQLAKGRTEEEIMDELGGPRLIARTIIDAAEAGGEGGTGSGFYREGSGEGAGRGRSSRDDSGAGSRGSSQEPFYGNATGGDEYNSFGEASGYRGFHVYDLNKWYWKLAGILIIISVIVLLSAILGGLVSVLLSPVGLFLLLVWLIWSGKNR
ncbi:DUF1700 domain-containing protein [Lachnospiraceae bacterium 62-35]